MRKWVGVGILSAFFAAVLFWPAPGSGTVSAASPAPSVLPAADLETEDPLPDPEELKRSAEALKLPAPPLEASKEAAQAYLDRLNAITQGSNADQARIARKLTRDYQRTRVRQEREKREQDLRKQQEERNAAHDRERAERKAARKP